VLISGDGGAASDDGTARGGGGAGKSPSERATRDAMARRMPRQLGVVRKRRRVFATLSTEALPRGP
jgi:hypothetical protein